MQHILKRRLLRGLFSFGLALMVLPSLFAQLIVERELVGASVATTLSEGGLQTATSFGETLIGYAPGALNVSTGFHQAFSIPNENRNSDGRYEEATVSETVAYPNPVRDWLMIDLSKEKRRFKKLQLVDLFGRVMVEKRLNDNTQVEMNSAADLPGANYYLYGIDAKGNRHILSTITVVRF